MLDFRHKHIMTKWLVLPSLCWNKSAFAAKIEGPSLLNRYAAAYEKLGAI